MVFEEDGERWWEKMWETSSLKMRNFLSPFSLSLSLSLSLGLSLCLSLSLARTFLPCWCIKIGMAASLYFLSCFSCLGVTDSTSLSSSFCTSVPLFSFLVFVIFNPFLFLYLWLASVLMPVAAVFCPWWFFFHLTPTFCLHGYAFAILLWSVPSSSPSFLSLSLSLSLQLFIYCWCFWSLFLLFFLSTRKQHSLFPWTSEPFFTLIFF